MKRTRTDVDLWLPSDRVQYYKNQRRRVTKRRGLLARVMQLPEDLIGLIQGIVINTQIRASLPRRQLMNNPSRYWGYSEARRMGSYVVPLDDPTYDDLDHPIRFFGWGGGGEYRGWMESIRRHLYARNVEGLR